MRTYTEVIDWNALTDEQKKTILGRLEAQIKQTMARYVDIVDQTKLKEKLEHHHVKYRPHFHPLCWAHTLLKEGAGKIQHVVNFGLTIKAEYCHLTLIKLIEMIDDDIYALAQKAYSADKKD